MKTLKTYIQKLAGREDLDEDEARDAMEIIFTTASDAEIAAFLIALKMKGEVPGEIAGLAEGMRRAARTIHPDVSGRLVDTCGTGGDAKNTINISTAAAIIASAAGVSVAKHGNYSVTSRSGSADVLKALGITIDLPPEEVERCIEKIGIGFMLAPIFHPSMRRVAGIRRELGVRTVFNILGPLTNPAGAEAQLIGCFDKNLCETFGETLKIIGVERAMIVHGDGLDEITTTGRTDVTELEGGRIRSYTIRPEDLGLPRAEMKDLEGGLPRENASDIIQILLGRTGPKRDIVVLNAGAAILVSGMVDDLREGVETACRAIDDGSGLEKLREFVRVAGDPDVLDELIEDVTR
ncbi:Anthranilate phosphoribosyltransferase [Candidatus Methanoperedenaceae archaeon GB50]|nr:MAG: Anthranilate phosphoribosyltransferase [Candidatus Methanoperedenaceae archaeon GB50]CAD7772189.1 Anthranilate phosphoribosyltransferase [Candidatus Methanoperedenaceae archaeon GB50]